MASELDKFSENQKKLNDGFKSAGMPGVLDLAEMTFGEVQKLCARHNCDLSASCIRPVDKGDDHE